MRHFLLLAAVASIGALAGYASHDLRSSLESAGDVDLTGVGADEPRTINALGRIQPRGGVILIAGPPGIRLAELKVKEGDEVEAGAVLAILEGRAESQHQVDMIDAQIAQARAQIEAEDEHSRVLDRELAIQRKQMVEIDPLDIQAQEASIAILDQRRHQVETDLDRMTDLHQREIVPQQTLEEQRLLLEKTRVELAAARTALEKLKSAHRIKGDQIEIEASKAGLASEGVKRAVGLAILECQRTLALDRLEQAEIEAPIAGRVLRVTARPGETLGARAILQLGDTSRMEVIAEVYEDSREAVEVGQAAEVTSSAISGGPIAGEVTAIGWMIAKNDILGLDPASAAYARVVEVRIALKPGDPDRQRLVETLTNVQVDVVIRRDAETSAPGGRP